MKYKLSKLAERDLEEIWQYTVDKWSFEQANRYLEGLMSAFGTIAEDPVHAGLSYEHIRPGYRRYRYVRHMIFYREMSDGTVLIVRVLHERMNVDASGI